MRSHHEANRLDALVTQPAPPSASGTFTVIPARKLEELRDLRLTIRRLLLLGTCVWPLFFVVDVIGAYGDGLGAHVIWLVCWRLTGSLLGAIAYFAVRGIELRLEQLRAIDAAVVTVGTALLALL